MKKLAFYRFILIVFTLSLLYLGCTGNPIGSDEISSGKRQMKGIVQLENGHSPEGVYVWMEGFDLNTFHRKRRFLRFKLAGVQQRQRHISGVFLCR